MMHTPAHRQYSLNCRTCCICDRPCAILDCQCLENFQHNASEHGNLMKRLSTAFSMPVSASDLHSFSLCCSCEHHLVVIEQANRIKECIKRVFLETCEHRRYLNSNLLTATNMPAIVAARAKRRSSFYSDSRSFDETSPRVKRSRISTSSSSLPSPVPRSSVPLPRTVVPLHVTSHHLSFDGESHRDDRHNDALRSPGAPSHFKQRLEHTTFFEPSLPNSDRRAEASRKADLLAPPKPNPLPSVEPEPSSMLSESSNMETELSAGGEGSGGNLAVD